MSIEAIFTIGVVCTVFVGAMVAIVSTQYCNREIGRAEQRARDAEEYRRNPVAFEARVAKDALDQARAEYGLEAFMG